MCKMKDRVAKSLAWFLFESCSAAKSCLCIFLNFFLEDAGFQRIPFFDIN